MRAIYLPVMLLLTVLAAAGAACVNKEYPSVENYSETEYKTEYATEVYSENTTINRPTTGEYDLAPLYIWDSPDLYFKGLTNLRYYAYNVPDWPPYDNITIRVSVLNQFQYETADYRVFDMTAGGHIDTPLPVVAAGDTGVVPWTWITGNAAANWLDSANTKINQARFLGGRTNVWSNSDSPQIMQFDAGKAKNIAIIITGPANQWNINLRVKIIWQINKFETQTVTGERQVPRQMPYQVQRQRTVIKVKQVPFWEQLFSSR